MEVAALGYQRLRASLAEAYWSEVEHVLEPGERPLHYLRTVGDTGKGFCYLTDRRIGWTTDRPRGGAGSYDEVELDQLHSVAWTEDGRFALCFHRGGGMQRREFCPSGGESRSRVTLLVWKLAAGIAHRRRGAGSEVEPPLPGPNFLAQSAYSPGRLTVE